LAVNSGFKAYENLSVIHFTSGEIASEFSRLEKKRLFIELNRHDNYLIVKNLSKKIFFKKPLKTHFYKRINIYPEIFIL